MALNTNWMRRTGWAKTFVGTERKLLVQPTQIPRVTTQNLQLGLYRSVDIYNRVRRTSLCLGSPVPMDKLLRLRDYGRVISYSDGSSFRV
ncbi:hypothetical protein GQ44DRAFT_708343, partial [Phaeosphaeriaceae sp. PMI808]